MTHSPEFVTSVVQAATKLVRTACTTPTNNRKLSAAVDKLIAVAGITSNPAAAPAPVAAALAPVAVTPVSPVVSTEAADPPRRRSEQQDDKPKNEAEDVIALARSVGLAGFGDGPAVARTVPKSAADERDDREAAEIVARAEAIGLEFFAKRDTSK